MSCQRLRGEAGCGGWALLNERFHCARQVVAQVESVTLAVLNDREGHGGEFTSALGAEEEPVFLPEFGGTNSVFDEVVVEFDSSVQQVSIQS